jgi:hypothetical protein
MCSGLHCAPWAHVRREEVEHLHAGGEDDLRHDVHGGGVIGCALTTLVAGLTLFGCTLQFVTKMATLLTWTIIVLSLVCPLPLYAPLRRCGSVGRLGQHLGRLEMPPRLQGGCNSAAETMDSAK